jgi:hypothetical protein
MTRDRSGAGQPDDARLAAAIDGLVAGGPYRLSALGGSSGRTFLATGSGGACVVRLDADVAVLERLAHIAVGPAVMAAGDVGGRAFVVQELVTGGRIDRPWLAAHVPDLADLVARYQSDAGLALLATSRPELTPSRYGLSLVAAAEGLSGEGLAAARGTAAQLLALAGDLATTKVTATHGDPNSENFLAGSRLLLVDWDDLALADPMRDIGQLAWWYLPEEAWPSFLAATGEGFDGPTLDRLYWWVAAESLDVGLRLHGVDAPAARSFFDDAMAALDRQPNPRRGD